MNREHKQEKFEDLENGKLSIYNIKNLGFNVVNLNNNSNIHATNEVDKIYSYYSKEASYKNIFKKKDMDEKEKIYERIESGNVKLVNNNNVNDSIFNVVKTISNYPPPGPRKEQKAINNYNSEENQKLESYEGKYFFNILKIFR